MAIYMTQTMENDDEDDEENGVKIEKDDNEKYEIGYAS